MESLLVVKEAEDQTERVQVEEKKSASEPRGNPSDEIFEL